VSFALIVSVVAWIVTHPNKLVHPVEPQRVVALAPGVETTAAPPAPLASPSVPVIETIPAFHRSKQPDLVVSKIPLVEDDPPPLPPPPPAAPEPKHHAEPAAPTGETPVPPTGETYGTQVLFLNNPTTAAGMARHDHKLMFVMHISGNFEDACFT
jgi:hypothetical protein